MLRMSLVCSCVVCSHMHRYMQSGMKQMNKVIKVKKLRKTFPVAPNLTGLYANPTMSVPRLRRDPPLRLTRVSSASGQSTKQDRWVARRGRERVSSLQRTSTLRSLVPSSTPRMPPPHTTPPSAPIVDKSDYKAILKNMRHRAWQRRSRFALSKDAEDLNRVAVGKKKLPSLTWSVSRKSHNKRMHALVGNGMPMEASQLPAELEQDSFLATPHFVSPAKRRRMNVKQASDRHDDEGDMDVQSGTAGLADDSQIPNPVAVPSAASSSSTAPNNVSAPAVPTVEIMEEGDDSASRVPSALTIAPPACIAGSLGYLFQRLSDSVASSPQPVPEEISFPGSIVSQKHDLIGRVSARFPNLDSDQRHIIVGVLAFRRLRPLHVPHRYAGGEVIAV